MLTQGNDDHVVITLLKEKLDKKTEVYKSMVFDHATVQQALQAPKGPEKCHVCGKTVYPTERIAPNNLVRSKSCCMY